MTLSRNGDTEFLKSFKEDLPGLFLVSHVEIQAAREVSSEEMSVSVSKARGQKCERCWNYRETVGKDKAFETLCHRCVAVLKGV